MSDHSECALLNYYYYCEQQSMEKAIQEINKLCKQDQNDVFHSACISGNLTVVTYFLNNVNSVKLKKDTFTTCCLHGHLDIAQLLFEQKTNEVITNSLIDDLFFQLCKSSDNLDMVIFIDDLFEICIADFFDIACLNPKTLSIAKWIYYELSCIDLSFNNYSIFRKAIISHHYELLEWLASLNPHRYFLSRKNKKIVKLVISENPMLPYIDFVLFEQSTDCMICYEQSNLLTNCNHEICETCALKLTKPSCPYCRQSITGYTKKLIPSDNPVFFNMSKESKFEYCWNQVFQNAIIFTVK